MLLNLITYGCGKAFDPAKFKPITNRDFVKPDGGLWASPVTAEESWRAWCEAKSYGMEKLKESFTFQLDGRVLVIDSRSDMEQMPWLCHPELHSLTWPDFEAMAKNWDAIYLTAKGQWATRLSLGHNLYGWDCESVLVMNPTCVAQLRLDLT
jgi:hypothetical protein